MSYLILSITYAVVSILSLFVSVLYGEFLRGAKRLPGAYRVGLELLLYTAMVGYLSMVMFGPIPGIVLGEEFVGENAGIRKLTFYASIAALVPGAVYYARKYGGRER